MKLNLFAIAYPVTVLGPGHRLVVWVAGCKKRCKGCISPEMLNPKAGKKIEISILMKHLSRINYELDGITISGGEPFDQAGPILELLTKIKRKWPAWNNIIYSGHTLAELEKKRGYTPLLLKKVDVLIDGPYKQMEPAKHPLAGSGNQGVHYLSRRGKLLQSVIDTLPWDQANLGYGPAEQHLLIGVVNPLERNVIQQNFGIRTRIGK